MDAPAPASPGQTPSLRFAGFDGVRGIAILLVVAWHSLISTKFPVETLGPLGPVVLTGWAGVDLFFALSGFLITTLILREERARVSRGHAAGFSVGRFYIRRALRILPIFFFVFAALAFVLGPTHWFPSITVWQPEFRGSPFGLLPYATFWGNYFAGYPPVGAYSPGDAFLVYWSLCVEEHFYVVWPLFLVAVRQPRLRVGVAVAVCTGVAGFRAVALVAHLAVPTQVHVVSHFRIDSILWGAAGALLWQTEWLRTSVRRIALCAAWAAVAVMVATKDLSIMPPGTTLGHSLGLTLLALAATLLVMELASAPGSPLARGLEFAPLRAIGRVSYGMYLVHFPLLDLARRWFFSVPRAPTVATFGLFTAFATVLTFAAAFLLYQIVERPILRLKEHWRSPGAPV